VLALGWGAITAADFAYAGARRAAAQGNATDLQRELLEAAASLDPLNAFYRHQLGTLSAESGDMPQAAAHLEAALGLNPADDVVGRSLGLVYLELDREEEADALIAEAVDLRTLDVANQLTRTHVELERGMSGAPLSAARVVRLSHWIAAEDDWQAFLGEIRAQDVTDAAIGAGTGSGVAVGPFDLAWLLGLGGRGEDAWRLGVEEADATAQAIGLIFECRFEEASAALDGALRTEASSSNYWLARYLVQRLQGEDTAASERIMALFSPTMPAVLHGRGDPGGISPLVDELRDSHLYHRLPMPRAESPWSFPHPGGGVAHWLREPESAARLAASRSRLAECVGE
jgi:tetratricopeptide (TPR) repeat protein